MPTITEALAEIKTIGKRLEKKREFITAYLARQDIVRDPLERDGGSREVIVRERQSVTDLEARIVALRLAIANANDSTIITVQGDTRAISEWLIWRREVAPNAKKYLERLASGIHSLREDARRKGINIAGESATAAQSDLIINIDERALAREMEHLETVLGELDGQLSLKNATVQIGEVGP